MHFPISGKLHAHALVHLGRLSRKELRDILQKHFPGPRVVSVRCLRKDQSIHAAMKRLLNYSAETRPYVPHDREFDSLDRDYTERAGLCLLSRYYLSGGKYEGLRFSINVRADLKWKGASLFNPTTCREILIPEMEHAQWIPKRAKRGAPRRSSLTLSGGPI